MSNEILSLVKKAEVQDPNINANFDELFAKAQNKSHKIVYAVPIANQLKEGEIYIYSNRTDTFRIYTKINGALYYVNLTAV